MLGDHACAEGAILAGCRFFAGYPITPATEIAERMSVRLPQVAGNFMQMEDELASMNAVLGASWAGIKSMTATSGPGFSLMMENLGLGIMLETPCVLVNVQRGGPSTGLPGEISEDPETRDLHLLVENTTSNRLESHIFDMLVLAVGAVPGRNTETIRQMVSLSKSPSGFLREAHPKLRPVDTPTKGVFIAGGAESPKDVRESVTQDSAAASRAAILLNKDEFSVDVITAVVEEDLCKLCGICADVCPFSAITWQKGQLAEVITAACTGCGTCAAECKFNAIA